MIIWTWIRHVEDPLTEMLRNKSVSDFRFFSDFGISVFTQWNILIEPKSKSKIHLCFICVLYIQSEDNFIQYFGTPAFWLWAHHIRSGVEFSTYGLQVLDFGGFQILGIWDFQARDTQMVVFSLATKSCSSEFTYSNITYHLDK